MRHSTSDLLALRGKAEILAEERHHMILKAVGDRARVRAVVNLKADSQCRNESELSMARLDRNRGKAFASSRADSPPRLEGQSLTGRWGFEGAQEREGHHGFIGHAGLLHETCLVLMGNRHGTGGDLGL